MMAKAVTLGRRAFLSALAFSTSAAGTTPEDRLQSFDLWPGLPPGTPSHPPVEALTNRSLDPSLPDRVLTGVVRPRLDYYPAIKPTGAAVVVVPGGGYVRIAIDKEGVDIGRWLSARGVDVFVVTYRLPGDGWTNVPFAPVADGQRAMRWVRFHASRFQIDPQRIGLIGFSAGGHLAASVLADGEAARYPAADEIDSSPIRPDMLGLFYPVLDMSVGLAHSVSRKALFDAAGLPKEQAEVLLSPNRRVPKMPPPSFLCCALDDPSVPPDNTLAMIANLRAQGGQVEAHLFQQGGHGFGIRKAAGLPVAAWPDLLYAWVGALGLLDAHAER